MSVLVCVLVYVCMGACPCRSEDNLWDLAANNCPH